MPRKTLARRKPATNEPSECQNKARHDAPRRPASQPPIETPIPAPIPSNHVPINKLPLKGS